MYVMNLLRISHSRQIAYALRQKLSRQETATLDGLL